ncbi:hypothetical protein LY12_001450 [Prauserella alba]|uniref:PknH-like extracellular domain-containing protein n=2 Tax=Prauserella alba TaxID=176898 RepID=A0ABP4FPK1_9PSEU|nr:hypothetical protein [Prauserella alba]
MAGLPVAITLLTVVAGCADRENDLDTYYDDRQATGERSDDAAAAPPSDGGSRSAPSQRRDGPAGTGPAQPAGQGVLLTAEDVAEEGVVPIAPSTAGADPAAPTCLATIAQQSGAAEVQERAWRYPTGSTLHHLVTRYEDRSAADVLAGQVACGGEELPVSGAPEGVETNAWCQVATCTVVIAAEDTLSTVEVRAADQGSATEAVHRLAPLAVGKYA